MLGPIFHLEMLLGGRRGRQHFLRWFVGGLLTLQLIFFYVSYRKAINEGKETIGITPAYATADFATNFTLWVINQQYLIILLATPAFAAGAITDEKTRGTLLYLFGADLTAWEILIGKLLGRTFEVAVLLLATLPFVCYMGVWAGLSPISIFALILALLGPIFAVGSASLLMSVWCRQTRDAVIGLFAIGGVLYLLWAGLNWAGGTWAAVSGMRRVAGYFDPQHVAGPALTNAPARDLFAHVVGSWVAWGSIGLVCFSVAVWRLRGAYMRQLEHSGKRTIGEWIVPNRAPVSDEPMLWKERHVDGIAPLAFMKIIPRWFALPVIALLTCALVITLIALGNGQRFDTVLRWFLTLDLAAMERGLSPPNTSGAFFALGAIVLVLACLVVGIRCSGAISGEREKQTWEALLLTPLATKQLIRIKLWGILGAAAPYVLAYLIPALLLATIVSPPENWVMTAGVATFSLFLAVVFRRRLDSFGTYWAFLGMATVTMVLAVIFGSGPLLGALLMAIVTTLAMFYMGAAGIWSSTRLSGSWRSLLSTMGIGYVGGLLLWVMTVPITAIIAVMLWFLFLALATLDAYLGTQTSAAAKPFATGSTWVAIMASCIVLAATFFGVPWIFIFNAERRVSETERVRVWREEDLHIPGGRRRRRYRRLKVKKAT